VNLVHDQHDSGQVVGARKTDGGWSMTGARGAVTGVRGSEKIGEGKAVLYSGYISTRQLACISALITTP
jgi:hypothetical protein